MATSEKRKRKLQRGAKLFDSRRCEKSGKKERSRSYLILMKPFQLKTLTLFPVLLGLTATVFGQNDLNLPDVSQAAMIRQRIALTDITITYHRPLTNGRKIWGGLVPFGQVWRAGANENTTIEVTDPVTVEGQALPKGIYGLHMIPTPDSWTVIFSKTYTGWGSYSYKQEEDALRVNVKPRPLTENEEALDYAVRRFKAELNRGNVEMGKAGGAVYHCRDRPDDSGKHSRAVERSRSIYLAITG